MKIRATTNPIGLKFHEVMAEKGIEGDYKALAAAFGVRTPSVYDWIDHARIGKERFARLVEWSGRSLHWWFDIEPPIQAYQSTFASESPAVYEMKQRTSWPFSRPFDAYERLSHSAKARMDAYLSGLIDAEHDGGAHAREQRNGSKQGP